jgi:hypothetical protein
MKKYLLLLICIFMLFEAYSQLPKASITLQSGDLQCFIKVDARMFDTSSKTFPHVTNGLFLSAEDSLGYTKVAYITYPTDKSTDFFGGPITTDLIPMFAQIQQNFDKIWLVKDTEIQAHLQDLKDGKLDTPISSIMSWPGRGNPFFKQYNGFDFPSLDPQNDAFAPFFDEDKNGKYDPTKGDFPLPTQLTKQAIPEKILWSVSNDAGGPHTESGGIPIRAEVQKTIWTVKKTTKNKWNGAVFGSYRIVNRSKDNLDSVYVSEYSDIDFGCDVQHKIIIDSLKNTLVDYLNYDKNEKCTSAIYSPNPKNSILALTMLNQKILPMVLKTGGDARSIVGARFGKLARNEAKNFDFVYTFYQDSTKTFSQLLNDMNNEIPVIQGTYNGNNVVSNKDLENIDFQCIIYPNPVHETLNMTWNDAQQNTLKRVSVVNIYGQILATIPIETNQLIWQYNVQHLPTGTYILSLETADGVVNRKVEVLR